MPSNVSRLLRSPFATNSSTTLSKAGSNSVPIEEKTHRLHPTLQGAIAAYMEQSKGLEGKTITALNNQIDNIKKLIAETAQVRGVVEKECQEMHTLPIGEASVRILSKWIKSLNNSQNRLKTILEAFEKIEKEIEKQEDFSDCKQIEEAVKSILSNLTTYRIHLLAMLGTLP